jgi:hypothetical protein
VDSGKPEGVYRSHMVRDVYGKVCCPTLLSQRCRECGKAGHTKSYCPTLKLVVEEDKKESSKRLMSSKACLSKVIVTNVFAGLYSSDEEEDKMLVVEKKLIKIVKLKDIYVGSKKLNWADCESDSTGSEEES